MEAAEIAAAPHLNLVERARLVLACGVAILLMYGVGWIVAEPVDPQLGVTFTQSGRSIWAVWPMMAALAAVTACVATVIAGRRLSEAGLFAAGIGLATLALRGNSMQMILAYCAEPNPESRGALMRSMACDCILWAGVMTAAWAASAVVRIWLWPEHEPAPAPDKAKPARSQTGWLALASTYVVGVFVIWLTVARTPESQIARGQVIGSVAVGLFLGAMAARSVTGVAEARWYVPAVLLVGLTGYLLGYLNAGMKWAHGDLLRGYTDLATTPPHDLVRPLPIEYIAVGVSAALAGFWSGDKVEQVVDEGTK
jgi:hypothetical protein